MREINMDKKIRAKLQKQMKQKRPYYAIIIPVGNIRDTMIIGEDLEKINVSSYLGSYENLDYTSKIKPVEPVGLKVIDNPEWFKKRMERLKKSLKL